MVQSDIKVQNSPSVGEVIIAVDVEDLAELRAAGPDVVLEAGRDVASEVQLGDEGLTSAAWRHHLNIQHRLLLGWRFFLLCSSAHLVVDVGYGTIVVCSGKTSEKLVTSILRGG